MFSKIFEFFSSPDPLFYYWEALKYESELCFEKAVKFHEKAASLGYADSFTKLGLMYQYGTHPDGQNFVKAIELYEKVIELGFPVSSSNMALLYEKVKDYKKAIIFYEKEANTNDVISIYRLERLYKNGFYDNESYSKLYEKYGLEHNLMKPVKPKKILNKIYQDINVDICSICRELLVGTEQAIHVLVCGHAYHYECIKQNDMKCTNRCS